MTTEAKEQKKEYVMPGLILEDSERQRRCATKAVMTIVFEDVTGATLTYKLAQSLAWTTDSEYDDREAEAEMFQKPIYALEFIGNIPFTKEDRSFNTEWTEPDRDSAMISPPYEDENDLRTDEVKWREAFINAAVARAMQAAVRRIRFDSRENAYQYAADIAIELSDAFRLINPIPVDTSEASLEAKMAEAVALTDADFKEFYAPHILRGRS